MVCPGEKQNRHNGIGASDASEGTIEETLYINVYNALAIYSVPELRRMLHLSARAIGPIDRLERYVEPFLRNYGPEPSEQGGGLLQRHRQMGA